jgi:hypothetical protein
MRVAALIITAILLPWALLRRAVRALGRGLRQPLSALADAVRLIGSALTRAVRRAKGALTVVTRGPNAALSAVVRGVIRGLVAVRRRLGAAAVAVVRYAAATAARCWRALTPIGRNVAASLRTTMGLLSAPAGAVARFLRRCGRPFGVLIRGAPNVARTALSVAMPVAQALIRVPARMLITARKFFRTVLSPFSLTFTPLRLAARAIAWLARRVGRTAAAVQQVVGRVARIMGSPLARNFAALGKLASRVAVTCFRATGRLLPRVLRPVLWASALAVTTTHHWLIAIRRQSVGVISLGLDGLVRVVVGGSRRLTRLRYAWRYRIGRIADACARMSRRTAHGARVAAGTARHHANRLAVSGSSSKGRLSAYADRSPSVALEDESGASFTLDVHENEFLSPGESLISAVISVSSRIPLESTSRPEMVEVMLLDCSASMGHPWDKIRYARRAAQAAVAGLPDGIWFAVVRGAESAEVAYPRRGGLVRASDRTRGEASRAIARLQPVGGTAMGRWLSMASELVALRPVALGHALLLTDGKDEDESPIELRAALEQCEGVFQCDCRGVGTDWAVEELRRVSAALLGTVDIIREPAGMEADFGAVIARAMSRGIEASMRIRTPVHARVAAFRQVSPTVVDLTARARRIDPQTVQFALGGWGDERREYHLSVDVDPGPVGSEMAACRVAMVVGKRLSSSALVRATWTDDPELAARIDPDVAHYTGQAELAEAIQEGLQAKREGRLDRAALRLGRAVQLAAGSGNTDLLSLLAQVVDVVDGDAGTVNLRRNVEAYDEMVLDTRSTRTVPTEAASLARVATAAGTTAGA